MEYAIGLVLILWWYMVQVGWFLFLIPFYVGAGIGLYRKDFKYPVIGLAVSWVMSWAVALFVVFGKW